MGRAKKMKQLRKPPRQGMPKEVWEVRGFSQHGDLLHFREEDERTAVAHAERLNGLGGSVTVERLTWNGPAAAYRRAYAMMELLVVLTIIGILIGLLLPAVQRVREAAARLQCANHLHQIGLALHSFHDAHGQFPTGGTSYLDPPTYVSGVPAGLPAQNAGWPFQLLPFIEQANLQRDPARVVSTPVPLYFCPARRAPIAIDSATPGLGVRALIDYASATGTGGGATGAGPYYGIIVRNPNRVAITDVTDGLSNTLVIGEKRLNPALYYVGCWYDDQGFSDGWDNDIVCITTLGLARDGGSTAYQFGSAHPSGMNALFGDGSVRVVKYDTTPVALTLMGDRRDGALILSE